MAVVDDATRTGAELETGNEERLKSAREMAMDQIDEEYDKSLDDQVQSQSPATEQATDVEAVLVDDLSRHKVRVKIGDGEAEERGLDLVVNELQTLQGRVRSFGKREKELQTALADRDKQLEQQLSAQQQLTETTATDESDIESRVSEMADALIDGDEDSVKASLRELLQQGRPQEATPVDEEQIVSKVKTELSQEREEAEAKGVWAEFTAENPVFQEKSDPETGNPIVTEEKNYGDFVYARDYAEQVSSGEISYREALNKTAAAVSTVFAKTEVPVKTEIEKRNERKQEIDQLPVAASVVAGGGQETAEESTDDVIAQMRKSRGLPG